MSDNKYDQPFYELDWDAEIEHDGNPFTVLPAGDYDFEVTAFERSRYNGGDKIPPCNMAILKLIVSSKTDKGAIEQSLFLYSKMEWKLCQFFTSIGHRKSGEPLKMNWTRVPGAKGHCKVGIRKWVGKDGKDHDGNEILEFYAPSGSATPVYAQTSSGYTAGRF